jgi:hypothetical protein
VPPASGLSLTVTVHDAASVKPIADTATQLTLSFMIPSPRRAVSPTQRFRTGPISRLLRASQLPQWDGVDASLACCFFFTRVGSTKRRVPIFIEGTFFLLAFAR